MMIHANLELVKQVKRLFDLLSETTQHLALNVIVSHD